MFTFVMGRGCNAIATELAVTLARIPVRANVELPRQKAQVQ